MADLQKELDDFVEQELGTWTHLVLQKLAAEIQKRNLVLSGELLKSLQSDVLRSAADRAMMARIAFEESGRIKDMNRVHYDKRPPIEVMEEYVKKVGVSNFNYVPGYRAGQFPMTESRAINRIAWGIAKHKLALNDIRPKKWFSRTFYPLLNNAIDSIVTRYQQATGEVIAGNFNID